MILNVYFFILLQIILILISMYVDVSLRFLRKSVYQPQQMECVQYNHYSQLQFENIVTDKK